MPVGQEIMGNRPRTGIAEPVQNPYLSNTSTTGTGTPPTLSQMGPSNDASGWIFDNNIETTLPGLMSSRGSGTLEKNLRDLGYTGALTQQNMTEGINQYHGGAEQQWDTGISSDLTKWLADKKYKLGRKEGTGEHHYGIFDEQNKNLGFTSQGYSNSGGWIEPLVLGTLAAIGGGAALSAAGGGAAGAGAAGEAGVGAAAEGAATYGGGTLAEQSAINAALAEGGGAGLGGGAAGAGGGVAGGLGTAGGALEGIGAGMAGGVTGAGGGLATGAGQAIAGAGASSWLGKIGDLFGGSGGKVLGGLADLYTQNKAKEGYKDILSQNNDEAYLKNLRSNLERRDAAAGRRSDYGSREVQLQAALAELQARRMSGQLAAQGGVNAANSGMAKDVLQIGSQVPWGKVGDWFSGWWGS